MLVLSRKVGQKLMIADTIEVTVLETKGDSVKLGISAPRSVSIYREEIYREILKANRQAGLTSSGEAVDSALNLSARYVNRPPEAKGDETENSAV